MINRLPQIVTTCKKKRKKNDIQQSIYIYVYLHLMPKKCIFCSKETLCKCYCQDPISAWQRGTVSSRLRLPRTSALHPCNEGQNTSSSAGSTSQQNHINNHPGTIHTKKKRKALGIEHTLHQKYSTSNQCLLINNDLISSSLVLPSQSHRVD